MNKFKYVGVDRILSKLYRELRGTSLNEGDVIEWIGEALSFLEVAEIQEEVLAFLEVKNYETLVPFGLQNVLQIAKNNRFNKSEECECPEEIVEKPCEEKENLEKENSCVFTDCQGNLISKHEIAYYRPYFDLQYEYKLWRNTSYYNQFTPIRLSNSTLFGNLVSKEKDYKSLYTSSTDEYTMLGTTTKIFRFSFREGQVAVSYLRNAIDNKTGYPLIPDDISFTTAITYYIKWKLTEWETWNNREGSFNKAREYQRLWNHYCRQAKNKAKMFTTIDEFQNNLEETHQMIPKHKRYFNFFGNLGREEDKTFNDPNYRLR